MMAPHNCCNRQKVKRGFWTPEEDRRLAKYISTYGLGCWSAVPTLAGLQRCGKSCRLRWINYLRPDLRRGTFTPYEVAVIIQLQRLFGNKWALIAKHLPGRTDNEIKNFWNSNLKKTILAHHQKLSRGESSSKNPDVIPDMDQMVMVNPNPQMDETVTLNPHLGQICYPTPPPVRGFDPIEFKVEPMINYNLIPPLDLPIPDWPNLANNPAPAPAPAPFANKNPNFQTLNFDDNFINNSFEENPIPKMNIKSETDAYDYHHDTAVFGTVVPEFGEFDKMSEFGNSPSMGGLGNSSSGVEMHYMPPIQHPNHINNIASLMGSFATLAPASSSSWKP